MTRKLTPAAGKNVKTSKIEPVVDPEPQERHAEPIMARSDGYYWRTPDGKQEFGPYDTLAEAQADMEAADEESPVPGESLEEAESEIGISDWIDPETGEPAEGLSHPRFDGE